MTTITDPGAYKDLPEDIYHADPVVGGSLSSTGARTLAQPGGPAKYRWLLDHPRPRTKALNMGSAVHSLLLGKGRQPVEIPVELCASNGAASTAAAKAWIADAEAAGSIPVKADAYATISGMVDALAASPEALALIEGATAREASVFARDERTGVMMRGRLDAYSAAGIVDYKTTRDASPEYFARRSAIDYGYHQQADWYLTIAQQLKIVDDQRFTFVLQETEPPYLVSVVELSRAYLSCGHDANLDALDLYSHCRKTGLWPGYPSHAVTVDPPMWLADSGMEM